jgi:hypothetical protein
MDNQIALACGVLVWGSSLFLGISVLTGCSRVARALRADNERQDLQPTKSWSLARLFPFSLFSRLRNVGLKSNDIVTQRRARSTREHPVSFGVGRGLFTYADARQDDNVMEQFSWLRREIHRDLGVMLPGVLVQENLNLATFEYVLQIEGNEVARGTAFPGRTFVLGCPTLDLDASWKGTHPVTKETGYWLSAEQVSSVVESGALAFSPLQFISLHLRHTLWSQASELISPEYTAAVLKRVCELEEPHPTRVQLLERHQVQIRRVFQAVLEKGGNLRDIQHIVRVFESTLPKVDSADAIATRALETAQDNEKTAIDGSVASAMLYTAHWNEMLCLELFPNMDIHQLGQLTAGLLKMQHFSGAAVERLWNELGGRTEGLVWGRSNQELAEHIRAFLQRGNDRPSKLNRLEKLAILILSLPKETGPSMVAQFLENFSKSEAIELAALVGRLAPFWSEAPMRADGRVFSEIGLRDRVIREFLEWRRHSDYRSPQIVSCSLSDCLEIAKSHYKKSPEAFLSLVQRRFFGLINPLGLFRSLANLQPHQTLRLMLKFSKLESPPITGEQHTAGILKLLPTDIGDSLALGLKSMGHPSEIDPMQIDSQDAANSLQLLVHYFRCHSPSSRDSSKPIK